METGEEREKGYASESQVVRVREKMQCLIRGLEREEERDRDEKEKLLEGGQAGGGSAINEAAVIRRTAQREKKDTSVRAR